MSGSSSARTTSTGAPTHRGAAGEESTLRRTRTDRAPIEPPHGDRIEPSIDPHAFPAGPSNAYEQLHGLGPEFGESGYRPPARFRLRRIAMMAAVFVVGAGVGLAAAWWLHKQPAGMPGSSVSSAAVRSLPGAPAAPAADGKRSAAIRGISPSELPYDGAPPPASEASSPEPVASRTPAPAEMPSGASTTEPVGEQNARAGEIEREAPVAASVTPPVNLQKSAQVPQADDEPKTAKVTGKAGASVATATPKRKSVARTDREIERIRRQVDEELKKKTEHGRGPTDVRPGTGKGARNEQVSRRDGSGSGTVARVSATRASLARCDRKPNFIRRELCRWQVCNGSWGKNGCPSYKQQASTY